MNNLKFYTRQLKHLLLGHVFTGGGAQATMIAALTPANTGSPLECAKEALMEYAIMASAASLDLTSIADGVNKAISECTTDDVSPCITAVLPDGA